jgi:putative inorganic carbon (HCO3(-)) transporter
VRDPQDDIPEWRKGFRRWGMGRAMSQRIRIQNYVVSTSKTVDVPNDRVFYTAIGGGVFVFFALSYPYREVYLPSMFLAALGLVILVALTIASWMRPQYYWAAIAFCIYIPFSGEYEGDFGKGFLGINFTNILMIPLLLQWFMQRSHMNERLVRNHTPDIPLICFCFLSSLALLRGAALYGDTYFKDYVVLLKRWLTPFLIYFIFVNFARKEHGIRYIIITICAALTTIAILAMKESYDIGQAGTWDKSRVRGVLGQANATGAFFVYYTLIFLGFFLCYWRQKRFWLLLIPFLICGRAMTLANSRGGLIAFTFAILGLFWFQSKRMFVVALIGVVAASVFPQYLPETISGRLFSTFRHPVELVQADEPPEGQDVELDRSAQSRITIWRAGIQLVKEKPFFGHGYGEFPNQVGRINPIVAYRDPHNTYLGIAVEMGLIALFFFVLTFLLIMRSCLYVYRHGSDRFMRAVGLAGVGMTMGTMSANFFGSRLDTMELTAYLWVISAIVVQYDTELRAKARVVDEQPTSRLMVDPWKQNGTNGNGNGSTS